MTGPSAPSATQYSYDPIAVEAGLDLLRHRPLEPTTKGFAGADPLVPLDPQRLVQAGVTLADPLFSTPLMVLRDSALEHNVTAMAQFCATAGVLLAPHAKTTMSPEIFGRQLKAGAWALTAANVTQAAVYARFGARRILIANEVADPAGIRALLRLLAALPDLEICCYVDSVQGVRVLDDAVRAAQAPPGRRLPVLVEYGVPNGRAGVRSVAEGLAVAEAVSASATLGLVGVSCFEGPVGEGVEEATLQAVTRLCAQVRELGEAAVDAGYVRYGFDGRELAVPSLVLSAGGSHHFDVVAAELSNSRVPGTRVVLRSGSYVAHDHGVYLRSSPGLRPVGLAPFQPAIEIWASVLSRPQPDLVLLNAGRRDVSFDADLPVVLRARSTGGKPLAVDDLAVTQLNDQHAFVTVPPSSELAVGDLVVLGVSHPCTTFDKWQVAVIVDDRDRVVDIAHTFF
jgi:D-serine deaminase-like pyridoxal phosphate-dependent protein